MSGNAPDRQVGEVGFWRLPHNELAAVLARPDLSWETARVYLALADLTRGYGRARGVVSLGQISERVGGMPRRYVTRALAALRAKGLCGQEPSKGQSVIRWVTWPPPPAPPRWGSAKAVLKAENTPGPVLKAENTSVPGAENRSVLQAENSTVPNGAPLQEEDKKCKKGKKNTQCDLTLGFAAFWEKYPGPRKGSRAQAFAKWQQLHLEPQTDLVLSCLATFARCEQWAKDRGQYVPMAVTWLNRKQWTEDPSEWPAPADGRSRSRQIIEERDRADGLL